MNPQIPVYISIGINQKKNIKSNYTKLIEKKSIQEEHVTSKSDKNVQITCEEDG